MRGNKEKLDTALYPKTDAELAADLRQFWQETMRFENELERRGYDVRRSAYVGGGTSVEINKINKDVL